MFIGQNHPCRRDEWMVLPDDTNGLSPDSLKFRDVIDRQGTRTLGLIDREETDAFRVSGSAVFNGYWVCFLLGFALLTPTYAGGFFVGVRHGRNDEMGYDIYASPPNRSRV
ncbi:MAG: hypothetical protein LBQ62_11070 [Candidatus Accumulibacter sp.]|jgi:hypothetical protein|nr:hypothetical protein [Accumulibacter sp.]